MSQRTETSLIGALAGIGRGVLVTGGLGVVLLLSSLGLLTISTSLALAVILWASRALVTAPVFALIILSEVVMISLAAGASLGGAGLLLKGIADALMRSGEALVLHEVGGYLENWGLNLERWVKGLMNWTKGIFKLILGSRKWQLLFVLLLGLLPPLLAISGHVLGAVIEPPGIALIKWAVPLSINFFKYAGIALGFALSVSLVIRTVEDRHMRKP